MDLSTRSGLPEAMDDPGLDEITYGRCLADLAALNRITLTHRAVLRWLERAVGSGPVQAFSVLDVAYGQGDLLRALAVLAQRRGWQVRLRGIDLNPRAAAAAQAATPAGMLIDYRVGDVFEYMQEVPPDFIVSSQFFHHLNDSEIVRLLQWFESKARKGWMITDLQRHVLPYYGFRYLAAAMRWHRIVRDDGTISIARSFRRRDWEALLTMAGVQGPGAPAEIRWRFPFRYTVSRLK
jgi:2-polyprenyl-3-methyl-5-hydroxy-6-metoxy-1,4-benzoquinol methylase